MSTRSVSPVLCPDSKKSTRHATPGFDFNTMCVVCGKSDFPGKMKHEKMVLILTDPV